MVFTRSPPTSTIFGIITICDLSVKISQGHRGCSEICGQSSIQVMSNLKMSVVFIDNQWLRQCDDAPELQVLKQSITPVRGGFLGKTFTNHPPCVRLQTQASYLLGINPAPSW
jgi:hypothetical protein